MSASHSIPSRARSARGSRRGALAAVLALAGLALAAPAPASALKLRPCATDAQFGCGTFTVPVDHDGAAKGSFKLAVAAQNRHPKGGRVLIALSGGPGQGAMEGASSFATVLAPALKRYRLVVFDQRGTGLSGALRCPGIQEGSGLADTSASDVGRCLRRLGPRRSYYATRDTVQDIETLRRALGVKKIALSGISYGTWVAQSYARTYPEHTDRLILDSIVSPSAQDPYGAESASHFPRVLRSICGRGACRGVTGDLLGDLSAVIARVDRGPLTGTTVDPRGRRVPATIRTEEQLWSVVTSMDLNPWMTARMPGALVAAREGDLRPLLRLRRIGAGPTGTPPRDFSVGLFFNTLCLDTPLAYPLSSDPGPGRLQADAAAFAKVPGSAYSPWSPGFIRETGLGVGCSQYPRQTRSFPVLGPLPDVPALLLSGLSDIRTPTEQARQVHDLLPRSSLVTVAGTGHDVIDSDITGCANKALTRFFADRKVGTPCAGKTNEVPVLPRPATALRQVPAAAGIPGDRGRAVRAVIDTAQEASFSTLEAMFAGFQPASGGLYGGTVRATDPFSGTLRLEDYSYVPGVRVSGTLTVEGTALSGRLKVSGRYAGAVRLTSRTRLAGTLGGRAFTYSKAASRAAGAEPADPAAIPALTAAALERLRVQHRLAR